MAAPMLRAGALDLPGVTHGFFTRAGGVSKGLYASLNGGLGSNDDPAAVAENRARMARALGVERRPASRALSGPFRRCRPCHGALARRRASAGRRIGDRCGGARDRRDRGRLRDGAVRRCGGACRRRRPCRLERGARRHSRSDRRRPWSGSARRARRSPPCWGRRSARAPTRSGRNFVRASSTIRRTTRVFSRAERSTCRAISRCACARPASADFVDLALDTYADEARFFSYRRSVHRREADYGRLVAAIALV